MSLWARATQPADWGYPQNRDVRSRDYLIEGNRLLDNAERWRLENTSGLTLRDNVAQRTDGRVLPTGPHSYPTAGAFAPCQPRQLLGDAAYDSLAPDLPGVPREVPLSPRSDLPRSAIVVDEWGPYDGRSPKLWPADTTRQTVPLRVLGPPGEWRVVERQGVASVSAEAGAIGDTLRVTPSSTALRDWSVTLEYIGEATVSPRGVEAPPGQPVRFSFERFEPLGDWNVEFFTWTEPSRDPVQNPAAFESLLAGMPAMSRTEYRLDYQWFTPSIEDLPQARWALDATTSVDLPAGEVYSLRTISDDAVRVWVDGDLVIDNWQPHGSIVDHAEIEPGRHELRVVHYQIDGWTEIRVEVVKGNARSTGSAGPH